MGFVSVSERCQPQRECASQDGSCSAHTDICNCSYCPADCARPPPLHSTGRFKNTEETQKVMYFSSMEFTTQHHPLLPHRVIFWAVQRMLAPNQSPTACTGSSPRWVGSSSWAVIGQWSLRVPVRYTRLRETQVSCRRPDSSHTVSAASQILKVLYSGGTNLIERSIDNCQEEKEHF